MKRKILVVVAAATFVLSAGYAISAIVVDHDHHSGDVLDHSGGTDANGCHTNHATGDYHCHNPK